MSFHTPHGRRRYRLPWSWSSFDYRDAVRGAVGAVRRPLRDGEGRGARRATRCTPTAATLTAPADRRRARLAARARPRRQRPAARGARSRAGSRSIPRAAASTSTSGSTARSSRRATPGRCPPRASSASASAPTSRATTSRSRRARSPRRLGVPPVRYQGNWFPHRLRPATEDGVFFVGDSRRPLLPALRRGDPHRLLLRHRLRPRAARRRSPASRPRGGAARLRRVLAHGHARAFALGAAAPAPDPGAAAAAARPRCCALVGRRRSSIARSAGTCARPIRRSRPGRPRIRSRGAP